LHLPGFVHIKLACRFRGCDCRRAGVEGELVEKLLA
jgi:hypothetical protein